MFETIGTFSSVYFSLSALLFLLILFEKKLINIEDKIKERIKNNERKQDIFSSDLPKIR